MLIYEGGAYATTRIEDSAKHSAGAYPRRAVCAGWAIMGIELRCFDDLQNDMVNMAAALDDGPAVNRALKAGAVPIEEQMLHNASTDPKIITGDLHDSIRTGNVGKKRGGGKRITIGVHYKDKGAFYANPLEFGHGGPAPAPAHPFVRPAFDVKANEALEEMKRVLRDELNNR